LSFDGKAASWPPFKTALHKFLDKEGCGWVVEGGNAFCAMLQAAAAKAVKSKTASEKGTVSTNVADYAKKDLQAAFANATVTTSVLLELISNRKTVLGCVCVCVCVLFLGDGDLLHLFSTVVSRSTFYLNSNVKAWHSHGPRS